MVFVSAAWHLQIEVVVEVGSAIEAPHRQCLNVVQLRELLACDDAQRPPATRGNVLV